MPPAPPSPKVNWMKGPAAEIKNTKVNATFCFTRHLSGSKSKLLKVHCFKRQGGHRVDISTILLHRGGIWYTHSMAIVMGFDGRVMEWTTMMGDGRWRRLDWTFFIHFIRCRRVWNTVSPWQNNDNWWFYAVLSYRKMSITLALVLCMKRTGNIWKLVTFKINKCGN